MSPRPIWLTGLMICLIGLPSFADAQGKGKGKGNGNDKGGQARQSEGRSSARPEKSRPSPSVNRDRGRSAPTPKAKPSPSAKPSPTPSARSSQPINRPERAERQGPSRNPGNSPRSSSSLDSLRQRLESNGNRGNSGRPGPERRTTGPDRNPANRLDMTRENRPERGGDNRPTPNDVRDMFNRDQSTDRNRPGQGPDRGDNNGQSLQDRLRDARENSRGPADNRVRPGNAEDIQRRLREMNRGDANNRPNPADRDRGPQIDRDRTTVNRPNMQDRPQGPNRADGDRRGNDRPGDNRVGNNQQAVRPNFDWRDRSQRDSQFRDQLQAVQQRGSLDHDRIRNELVRAEKNHRDRDGHHERHRDGQFDRNWDGRWGQNDWHHVPNNWYRYTSNIRNNAYRHFHYGWNNNWRPNNRYLNNWLFYTYTPRPGYWWSWGSPYRLSTWGFWGSNPTYPVYYDYGSTIVYDTQYIYVQDEPIATREQYALQAIALANEGRKQLQSKPPIEGNGSPEDWLPLGVFVLTDTETGQGNIYLQLAVDKDGLIAGTYYNASSENSLPIWGKVDPTSQRVAWMIGETSSTVMETGIYNLSQEASSVLVHYGVEREETWMLVRLPEDPNGNELP